MTQPTTTDSDAYRFRTKLKPYAVGVGAVLALLLAIWIPPFLVEQMSFAMLFSQSPVADTVTGILEMLTSDVARSLWAIGLLAMFVRWYNLDDLLRKQRSLVRTVAAGGALLIALTISFQVLDVATSALTGSLWHDSVWEALLSMINVGDELSRLIPFGVAIYTALSRGHSVAGHRDTYLLTYLSGAVLATFGNTIHVFERVLYGDAPEGVGTILDMFVSDLFTSVLWVAILSGTFGIVFAYGIERYGAGGVKHDRSAVADGGEK